MRPIAMKCTQNNWDNIKTILEENKVDIKWANYFERCPYLVTNLDNRLGVVSNVLHEDKESHNRQVYEEWNKNTFLDACGVKVKGSNALKFKAGDKVRIINRKPTNKTGNSPKCFVPHVHEGEICYLYKETMEYGLDTFEDGDHVGGILCAACDWDGYVEITEAEYDFLKKKRAKDRKAYLKYKAEQALNCRPPINRY